MMFRIVCLTSVTHSPTHSLIHSFTRSLVVDQYFNNINQISLMQAKITIKSSAKIQSIPK